MNMVIENGLEGFDEHDEKIIGCICRYHRGSLPDKEEHEIYNTFDKKDRKIVRRLAGILKISDGLDRGHLNLIKKIHINYDEENSIVEFILTPNTPEFHPDITSAIRKRDLFEIGFKCQCVLKFED
jgi:exopolyphosphatase/guanosine-5'-triphosphate,3'-diphosphate pyrophosphatase